MSAGPVVALALWCGCCRAATVLRRRRSRRRSLVRLARVLPVAVPPRPPGAVPTALLVTAPALCAAAAAVALLPSVARAGAAAVVAGTAAAVLVRWAPPRVVALRPAPERAPPPGLAAALDLLAACLVAGSPVVDALAETAAAVDPAVARPLAATAAALRRGLSGPQAWAAGLGDRPAPALTALARAAMRSERGGVPLESSLARLSAELRAAAGARADRAAQRAGVLVVLPLGLCFLPAYLLLGVAPAVLGLAARIG